LKRKLSDLYEHINNKAAADGYPPRHVVEDILFSYFNSIRLKDEKEKFLACLDWIHALIKNLIESLQEIDTLKSILKNETKDEDEDKDIINTISYQFEKLTSPVSEIFSPFGERRWVVVFDEKSNPLDQK
jgi:hypothetical protein